jgi:uncharacterized membrane protein YedE/YeeE
MDTPPTPEPTATPTPTPTPPTAPAPIAVPVKAKPQAAAPLPHAHPRPMLPFLFSIALGGVLGSTALTAAGYVLLAFFASDVLKTNAWTPPMILGEILGALIAIPAILAAFHWRRNVAVGSIIGIGLGLAAGNACALYIASWFVTPPVVH